MGEGDGRVVVAGGEKSLGGGQFINALRGEADEGEDGNGSWQRLAMAKQRGGEEAEQRAVETGKTAVEREVRLREPDGGRDHECGESEGGGRADTRVALAASAEDEQDDGVPREMVDAEMGEMGGEKPPQLTAGERGAVELQPRGRRGREVAGNGGAGEDRGEQGEASFHGRTTDGFGRVGEAKRLFFLPVAVAAAEPGTEDEHKGEEADGEGVAGEVTTATAAAGTAADVVGRGGEGGLRGIDTGWTCRLGGADGLRGALGGRALLVGAADAALGVGGVVEHNHRGVVGDELVGDAEVLDGVARFGRRLEAGGFLYLDLLDERQSPEALDLGIVGVDFGQVDGGGVGFVFAGERGAERDGGLAGALVAAEDHELLAAVDFVRSVAGGVEDAHGSGELEGGVVQSLVGYLALSQNELADDVVVVGDAGVEAAAGIGDGAEERPVGAVAHEETEDADVDFFDQLVEVGGVDDALIRDAVRNEDHTGRTIGIKVFETQSDAIVKVGSAGDRERFHEGNRVPGVFGRGVGPRQDLAGGVVKRDDTETVFGAHLAEGLGDAIGKRVDLALHGAGNVEDVAVVGAAGEGLQVHARRDDHHEGAGFVFGCAIRDDFDAAGEIVGEAVVEDEVPVEFRARAMEGDLVVAVGEFLGGGGGFEAGHAHIGDGPRGLQLDVNRERALDLRVRGPETLRGVIGAAVLERIKIAADAGVDRERLVVDEAQFHLGIGAHGGDFELVGEVTVLGGEAGVVAGFFFFLVGLFGFGFREDFAVQRFLAGDDGDLGEAGTFRDGKSVNGLEVGGVGIEERLQHLGLREAVVQRHVDLVGADLDGRVRGALRNERAAGEGGREAGRECSETGEQERREFHNEGWVGVLLTAPAIARAVPRLAVNALVVGL